MCGIGGIVGGESVVSQTAAEAMAAALAHRGPDGCGVFRDRKVALANRRLAVLDTSDRAAQPMHSSDERFVLTYNGEVYNYRELRQSLRASWRSNSDTEVVLEALAEYGRAALDSFIGMFGLALWDRAEESLLLARDRFGVKPLYYSLLNGCLYFASEIKGLAAAGIPLRQNEGTWADYLRFGTYDHGEQTFFHGVKRLLPGHTLEWKANDIQVRPWYRIDERVNLAGKDERHDDDVAAEYSELLQDSIRLRFRSDVPVGICLSGGLDSSLLLGLVRDLVGDEGEIHSYHFATGDDRYDETPWVRLMTEQVGYPLHISTLTPKVVPDLAEKVALFQEEPFGGLPTLAMTLLFEDARSSGTTVLLDGQGMDEQWAGYDYYSISSGKMRPTAIQGAREPQSLIDAIRLETSQPSPTMSEPFKDPLANQRHRDISLTKLPRALRFGDRASSQSSCELREPFLDHRLVELALRQPPERLIRNGINKFLLRRIAARYAPSEVAFAPKRPLQTPQREWLREELSEWVDDLLQTHIYPHDWFDRQEVARLWNQFRTDGGDSSFHIWQLVSFALSDRAMKTLNDLSPQRAAEPAAAEQSGAP